MREAFARGTPSPKTPLMDPAGPNAAGAMPLPPPPPPPLPPLLLLLLAILDPKLQQEEGSEDSGVHEQWLGCMKQGWV